MGFGIKKIGKKLKKAAKSIKNVGKEIVSGTKNLAQGDVKGALNDYIDSARISIRDTTGFNLSMKQKSTDIPDPLTAPDIDEEAVARARRRASAQALRSGGRNSTILTGGSGTLLG